MSKVVIFGTGAFAEVVHFYLTHDSDHEVVAFTAHRDRIDRQEIFGLPVVAYEDVTRYFPPDRYCMFIAIGYAQVNQVRARVYRESRELGYQLITYVSSRIAAWGDTKIGDNCFIFENQTIQPFVEIGNNTILWSGNHVGHHSRIGNHCFVTSHVVISGFTRIGDYSFLGVNATLRDNITIGRSNVIGAGAIIMRDTQDNEVYVPERTRPFHLTSDQISL